MKCADILNNYYIHLGKENHANMKQPLKLAKQNDSSMYMTPLTISEVITYIKRLKSNKGPGPDGIPVRIYKDNYNILASIITTLINNSITSGVFPKCLKIAKITPIPKVVGTTKKEEFRPIATLNILAKIYEMSL